MSEEVKIRDTRVAIAGVIRCCIGTVASEFDLDDTVQIGAKSACRHCKEPFTLIMHQRIKSERYPLWIPDWQINDFVEKRRVE